MGSHSCMKQAHRKAIISALAAAGLLTGNLNIVSAATTEFPQERTEIRKSSKRFITKTRYKTFVTAKHSRTAGKNSQLPQSG